MENDEEGTGAEPEPPLPLPPPHHHPQPLCRFFSSGRHCNFGKKCRFLHVRDDAAIARDQRTHRTDVHLESGGHRPPQANNNNSSRNSAPASNRRPCRYFLSGHCTMEDRCRYWHPPQLPPADEQPAPPRTMRPAPKMAPVPRPGVPQVLKLGDLTEEVAEQLRDTEVKQLKKRFPKDQLIVQERSDGKVTYYRATVEATDPDWPFDLKEVDIMVSFPDSYPQEIFTLEIPLDQDLPSVMGRHVQEASLEWLQAKHATNQLMGKVELLFRPYLRWLDRSLERLFTEGARQLKKDIDVEKAGLQFIPFQELQATICEKAGEDRSSDPAAAAAAADEDAAVSNGNVQRTDDETAAEPDCDEREEEEEEEEEGMMSHLVENIKISDPRRGTEVKVLGLRLGENTATVAAHKITVCLQCSRCKVTADLTLNGRTPCSAQCEKCSTGINAAFRPCMMHHYCDVLGYLDLRNVTPTDLVLQDCEFIVGCLDCSQDCLVQNLTYGQTKELNCEHCHNKLSILAESVRFQYIQPRHEKSDSNVVRYKTVRDPAVQKGKPLPDKGTCKHYKQSHRWLRFPCCGRAYPCDACHDDDQDHPMELATRMICGHCAKEQPYTNSKPCISCGGMMTRSTRTRHWEGGLGCRNKVKMSRNDRHKFANTNKTISRKAASEKK